MIEKKNSKGFIWLIGTLIVLVLGLLGFVVYDKVLKVDKTIPNNETITIITTTTTKKVDDIIIESTLPKNTDGYITYWDYNEIYDYYFKMNKDQKMINDIEDYPFLKIDNNKLMWNINGSWEFDNTILDDIKYFDIDINGHDSTAMITLLTTNNKLYRIDFDELWDMEFKEKKFLTDKEYSYFIYELIDFKGEIENISAKNYCECSCYRIHYIKSNNEIYILSNNIYEFDEFFNADNNILNIVPKCTPTKIEIELNGNAKNVFDYEGNKVKVKYYIMYYDQENEDNYNIIIDQNNKLYSFTDDNINESIKIKHFDTIIDFNYNDTKHLEDKTIYENIVLKLSNGKTINIGKK